MVTVADDRIESFRRGLSGKPTDKPTDKPTGLINEPVRQTGTADLTGY